MRAIRGTAVSSFRSPAPTMPGHSRKSHYLLIVDDDAAVREVLATLLVEEGHRCATAADATTALAMVGGEPFELVLSDLKMPGRDGLWLLEQMKAVAPGVPVVILTGHGGREREDELLERGAAGFLLKPPNVPELLELIERLLAR